MTYFPSIPCASQCTAPVSAPACCDFAYTSSQGVFIGGSIEFPLPIKPAIVFFNEEEEYSSTAPGNKLGLSWISKYGFAGINAFGMQEVIKGINVKGLTYSCLTLQETLYQNVSPAEEESAIAVMDLGLWILGSFQNVSEVKEALPNVKVWGNVVPALNSVLNLHFAIHDAQGNHIVVEYLNSELKIYENPVGVLTNDPPLPWHLANLTNYNQVTNMPAGNSTINGVTISTSGMGGLQGLPGDTSSATRFLTVAKQIEFMVKSDFEDSDSSVTAGFHVLHRVDILKGISKTVLNGKEEYEITLMNNIFDIARNRIYYTTYNNITPRFVDLTGINFAKGTPHDVIPLNDKPIYINKTPKEILSTEQEALINIMSNYNLLLNFISNKSYQVGFAKLVYETTLNNIIW